MAPNYRKKARELMEKLAEEWAKQYPEVPDDPEGLLERPPGARLIHGSKMGSSEATIGTVKPWGGGGSEAAAVVLYYTDKQAEQNDLRRLRELMRMVRPPKKGDPGFYWGDSFVVSLAEIHEPLWSLMVNNYETPTLEDIALVPAAGPYVGRLVAESVWAGAWVFRSWGDGAPQRWAEQARKLNGCFLVILSAPPPAPWEGKPMPPTLFQAWIPNTRYQERGKAPRITRGIRPSRVRKPKEEVGEI